MTAPVITYPDFYDASKECDVEQMFTEFWQSMLPGVLVVSFFPEKDTLLANLAAGMTYLRSFRVGGQIIKDTRLNKGDVDRVQMHFEAASFSRDMSWQLIAFVRSMMYAYGVAGGRMKTDTQYGWISVVGELLGPQLTPTVYRDQRLVPVNFQIDVSRKGLPNYRLALDRLNLI